MQSQFEMNVYKYQCYSWFFLIYILFCIRNPTHIQFVDLFTFLQEFGHGFMLTFVHTWVYEYDMNNRIELVTIHYLFYIRNFI